MTKGTNTILDIRSLITGYGRKQILNGVDLIMPPGQLAALIGHNGAGKSTLMKAIFGLLPVWQGQISFEGKVLKSSKPSDLLRAGMAYIPQGNRIFPYLTVLENLKIGGFTISDKRQLNAGIERALEYFSILKQRLKQEAGTLSGGEKQVLALANSLVLSPRLLLLDEPSLGLAPMLVKDAMLQIKKLNSENNITILIIEQKVREVLEICDWVFCLKLGNITYSGSPQELNKDPNKLRQMFF